MSVKIFKKLCDTVPLHPNINPDTRDKICNSVCDIISGK